MSLGSPSTTENTTSQDTTATLATVSSSSDKSELPALPVLVPVTATKRDRSGSNTPRVFETGTPRSRASSSSSKSRLRPGADSPEAVHDLATGRYKIWDKVAGAWRWCDNRSRAPSPHDEVEVLQELKPQGKASGERDIAREVTDYVKGTSLQQFLEEEIDKLLPELDLEEEERCSKMARSIALAPMSDEVPTAIVLSGMEALTSILNELGHQRISAQAMVAATSLEEQAAEIQRLKSVIECFRQEAEAFEQRAQSEIQRAQDEKRQCLMADKELAEEYTVLQSRLVTACEGFKRLAGQVTVGRDEIGRLRAHKQELTRALEQFRQRMLEIGREADQRIAKNSEEASFRIAELETIIVSLRAQEAKEEQVPMVMATELHELRARCASQEAEIDRLRRVATSNASTNPSGATCEAGASCGMFKLGRCAYQEWHNAQGHGRQQNEPEKHDFDTPLGSVKLSAAGENVNEVVLGLMQKMDERDKQRDLEFKRLQMKMGEKIGKLMSSRRADQESSSDEEEDEDEQVPPPPRAGEARTTLSASAPKGITKLEVVSSRGFKIGMMIRIGSEVFEERIVTGIGSLLIDRPTNLIHLQGAPVVGIGMATAAQQREALGRVGPELHSMASRDSDSDPSTIGAKRRGKFEYKTSKLLPLPTEHWQTKTWLHKQMAKVEASSSRTDESERRYLLKVLEVTSPSDKWLYEVPRDMIGMDRVLLPELVKICEKDKSLTREVEHEQLTCINKGLRLTSAKVLRMIMGNLAMDKSMMLEVTSADLLAVKWEGDDHATTFYHEWLEVEGRIEAEAMSAKARMNLF